METIVFNDTEFTFERVESIKELPVFRYQIDAENHKEALKFWHSRYKTHVKYFAQEALRGKTSNVYAFVRPQWISQ